MSEFVNSFYHFFVSSGLVFKGTAMYCKTNYGRPFSFVGLILFWILGPSSLLAQDWVSQYQGNDKQIVEEVLRDLKIVENAYFNCSYKFESRLANAEMQEMGMTGVLYIRIDRPGLPAIDDRVWLRSETGTNGSDVRKFEIVRDSYSMSGNIQVDQDSEPIGVVSGVDMVGMSNYTSQLLECYSNMRPDLQGRYSYIDYLTTDFSWGKLNNPILEQITPDLHRLSVRIVENDATTAPWTLEIIVQRIGMHWCVIGSSRTSSSNGEFKLVREKVVKEFKYRNDVSHVPVLESTKIVTSTLQCDILIDDLRLEAPSHDEFDPIVYKIDFKPDGGRPTMLILLGIVLAVVLVVLVLNWRSKTNRS